MRGSAWLSDAPGLGVADDALHPNVGCAMLT